MALSKKHYEQFAYRIRNTLENVDAALPGDKNIEKRIAARQAVTGLARSLCVDFSVDNPKFDGAKFRAACGL